MPERSSPFDRLEAPPAPGAVLTPRGPAAAFILRVRRPEGIAAAGAAFGLPLPQDACRSAAIGRRSVLWLGPDEWQLMAPEEEGPGLADAIAEAMGEIPHSLVAVGERNVAFEIAGPAAEAVLNAHCLLDLHLSRFPIGMCTRTLYGKAEILLWRLGAERFYVGCWRSFAAYVWGLTLEARLEYTT
ncbi:sarcosine oxidase subunit gamma [Zavarzinia compransoris]|uniref:Sarcosine oxidase subunit gamma n=1 Tax=Zavarzinia compransoris TaxID=1264899 RepID=A0A317DW19_9PROT|nr:sarcosine oxidase subunit gamma family protein [Zavarzinia compransoris]PWR18066.1 sarcosine oxidase subunit gamma [Zavarzinia compransoris]TDP43461.1 sarcosine oxidase subunit gamma [Zavarzinia compransoris]